MGINSNLVNESKRRSADYESLSVKTELQSCFSFESCEFTITVENNYASLELVHGVKPEEPKKHVVITTKRARQLMNEF